MAHERIELLAGDQAGELVAAGQLIDALAEHGDVVGAGEEVDRTGALGEVVDPGAQLSEPTVVTERGEASVQRGDLALRLPHERLDATLDRGLLRRLARGRAELRAQLLELAREAVLTMAQRDDVRRGGLLALHGVTQRGDLVRGRRLALAELAERLGIAGPRGEVGRRRGVLGHDVAQHGDLAGRGLVPGDRRAQRIEAAHGVAQGGKIGGRVLVAGDGVTESGKVGGGLAQRGELGARRVVTRNRLAQRRKVGRRGLVARDRVTESGKVGGGLTQRGESAPAASWRATASRSAARSPVAAS